MTAATDTGAVTAAISANVTANPPTAVSPAICHRCQQAFTCGSRAGLPSCWCAKLPPLPAQALSPGQTCLCPKCLATALAAAQAPAEPDANALRAPAP